MSATTISDNLEIQAKVKYWGLSQLSGDNDHYIFDVSSLPLDPTANMSRKEIQQNLEAAGSTLKQIARVNIVF